MTIILNPQQEAFIQQKLKSGKYDSVKAVITEAFQLLEQRDKNYQKWVEETYKKVAGGEGIDGETVFARLREKIDRAREAQ